MHCEKGSKQALPDKNDNNAKINKWARLDMDTVDFGDIKEHLLLRPMTALLLFLLFFSLNSHSSSVFLFLTNHISSYN